IALRVFLGCLPKISQSAGRYVALARSASRIRWQATCTSSRCTGDSRKTRRCIVKKLFIVIGIMLAIGLTGVPQAAAADPWGFRPLDRSTLLTFSAPVALPTVTLPAGTYLFRFVDMGTIGPAVLQVMDKDGKV